MIEIANQSASNLRKNRADPQLLLGFEAQWNGKPSYLLT